MPVPSFRLTNSWVKPVISIAGISSIHTKADLIIWCDLMIWCDQMRYNLSTFSCNAWCRIEEDHKKPIFCVTFNQAGDPRNCIICSYPPICWCLDWSPIKQILFSFIRSTHITAMCLRLLGATGWGHELHTGVHTSVHTSVHVYS